MWHAQSVHFCSMEAWGAETLKNAARAVVAVAMQQVLCCNGGAPLLITRGTGKQGKGSIEPYNTE